MTNEYIKMRVEHHILFDEAVSALKSKDHIRFIGYLASIRVSNPRVHKAEEGSRIMMESLLHSLREKPL